MSVEKDASPFAAFRDATQLAFATFLSPHGGLADKIDFAPIPQTFVLDRTGHVQDVLRGGYAWDDDEKLARVLDRLR